jgi:prefoldin subunit 5
MTKKEVLEEVKRAYDKLDEAQGDLRRVRDVLDDAISEVNAAISPLESIPEEAAEIEDDEPDAKD